MSEKDLGAYREKRDFLISPEPRDGAARGESMRPIFVVQKHDASSLHYDFRLEVDGVLVSWAVPKGPSMDPSKKRLALPTDDHPLDYARFEGVIPEGQYGAGTVLVWDTGPYRNLRAEEGDGASMRESLEEGKVRIWLEGEKLRGGYTLVRMEGDKRWLLIKRSDEAADPRYDPVHAAPDSVLSGRSLEEIRAGAGSLS